MDTIALEGVGVRVQFQTSGLEADILAITVSDRARAIIDSTHLGTVDAKTFKVGDLIDLGTVDLMIDHDPRDVNLAGLPPEQISIRYPDDLGLEPLVLYGFVESMGGERLFPDDRLVTSATVRLTVALDEFTQSLADPTKWIGAWDFNVVGNPNLVGALSRSPYLLGGFDTNSGKYPDFAPKIGLIPNYLSSGGYASTRAIEQITISANVGDFTTTGTFPHAGDFSLLQFTIGAWVTKENYKNPDNTLHADSSLSSATVSLGGAGFTINGTSYGSVIGTGVAQFRCVTWDNGAWRYFEDGVEISSGTAAPSSVTLDRLYLRAATQTNYDNNFVSPIIHDNIVAYAGILSDSAISALSAGKMPDEAGNLA